MAFEFVSFTEKVTGDTIAFQVPRIDYFRVDHEGNVVVVVNGQAIAVEDTPEDVHASASMIGMYFTHKEED